MIERRAAALLLGVAVVLLAGHAAAERIVADRNTGCRIWDQYPDSRKLIRWSGSCRDGFAHGEGTLEWAYAGRYDGQVTGRFVEGRLDGRAHVEWADGRSMDGTFRRGRASGEGTFVWPDGRRYTGSWQDDHRTGFGTLVFPEGHRYVGWFERNRPTGQGEYVSAAGTRYAARIDVDGDVVPGPMLGAPQATAPQAAEAPRRAEPASAPPLALPPASLDEWLREPAPGTRRR
ncbi:MAG TPA: hypothetical protein VD995_04200 [Azospirillum sp.]|nr:hypothetical protein [Azospirillum sp.]